MKAACARMLAVLLVLFSVSCTGPAVRAVEGAPYVVLVTIDTLRADATSPYGAPAEATPALTSMAARSVQFSHAFTVMPTTGPSHLAMLTGLYPPDHGAMRNGVRVRPGTRSLAALMRASGRRTAAFVSVHHLGAKTLGLDGFETWDAPDRVRDGAATVAAAERWIAGLGAAPFFLWVHVFDPHAPYEAHPGTPKRLAEPLAALAGVEEPRFGGFDTTRFSARQRKKLRLLYQADVHYADAQVGKLLRFLERRGMLAQAAVVVTADHGEVLDEAVERYGYGFDHGKLLLPVEVRVPLWVSVPDGRRGVVEDAVVETRAVYGTLLAAAALPAPADVPALPGLHEASRRKTGPALVFRRSFKPGNLPDVLRGTRVGAVDATSMLVRVVQDDGVRYEAWRTATSAPALLPASLADAERARLQAVLDDGAARLARAAGTRHDAVSGEMLERLHALGYVD